MLRNRELRIFTGRPEATARRAAIAARMDSRMRALEARLETQIDARIDARLASLQANISDSEADVSTDEADLVGLDLADLDMAALDKADLDLDKADSAAPHPFYALCAFTAIVMASIASSRGDADIAVGFLAAFILIAGKAMW